MSAPGVELGATAAGCEQNFAWGALHLDAGDTLHLSNTSPTAKQALYVRELLLDGGTAQARSIRRFDASPGVNVYCDANNPANAYLGGKTYAGGTGVAIMPVLPEPAAAGALVPAAVGIVLRRRRCA
jgi:hypothetical protein